MRAFVKCILIFLVLTSSEFCSGEALLPAQILEKCTAVYKVSDTYKAEGTVVSNVEINEGKTTLETSFTLLLKKPDLYLITWSQKSGDAAIQSGAVWNDGSQRCLYMSTAKAYCPMDNDEMALGAATGVSGGVANTIPSFFLSYAAECALPFSRLTNPTLKDSEKIGDDDCFVISSPSMISKEETYWISKANFLIRKCSRSLEAPESGRAMPEMTDAQLEESVKAMGEEVTEKSKEDIKCMMDTMAKMNMKGDLTETHVSVSSPELHTKDFRYAPPEGAASMGSFGEMISSTMKNTMHSQCRVPGISMDIPTPIPDLEAVHNQYPKSTLDAALQPALAEAREKAFCSSCQNNLKQCGLVLMLYADETPDQSFPPLSPLPGTLMWVKEKVYPEYLADPVILVCPTEQAVCLQVNEEKNLEQKAKLCFNTSSYWYLGYALPDEKTGLAFTQAYRKRVENGGDFTADLKDAEDNPIYRLREGVERVFITDIHNPAGAAMIQSKLPVLIERPGHHDDQINVLFMDGHVERLTYPGAYPVSQPFIEALGSLDTLRNTMAPTDGDMPASPWLQSLFFFNKLPDSVTNIHEYSRGYPFGDFKIARFDADTTDLEQALERSFWLAQPRGLTDDLGEDKMLPSDLVEDCPWWWTPEQATRFGSVSITRNYQDFDSDKSMSRKYYVLTITKIGLADIGNGHSAVFVQVSVNEPRYAE